MPPPQFRLRVGNLHVIVVGNQIVKVMKVVPKLKCIEPNTVPWTTVFKQCIGANKHHQWPYSPLLVYVATCINEPCTQHADQCRHMVDDSAYLDQMVQSMTQSTTTMREFVDGEFKISPSARRLAAQPSKVRALPPPLRLGRRRQ